MKVIFKINRRHLLSLQSAGVALTNVYVALSSRSENGNIKTHDHEKRVLFIKKTSFTDVFANTLMFVAQVFLTSTIMSVKIL